MKEKCRKYDARTQVARKPNKIRLKAAVASLTFDPSLQCNSKSLISLGTLSKNPL